MAQDLRVPNDDPAPAGAAGASIRALPALVTIPLARAAVVRWPASWRRRPELVLSADARRAPTDAENRLLSGRNQLAKRIVDFVLAASALIVSLPVMAAAAVVIVVRDPGPVLYGQFREGRDGRRFRMWKLRTMYTDADGRLRDHLRADEQARREWEREFKITGDPRVLPAIGTFLRRWSLDECPQLWNVLKGDMSLVGPRALPAYHLEAFDPSFREKRRTVRPGITGLWQVTSRGRGAIRRQQALDSHYIANWSVRMDAFVLAKTVQVVISGRGAR